MPVEDFIIWVYCWVDKNLKEQSGEQTLRQRGFQPALSDAEVITMEIVGEFKGIDTNYGLWRYFKHHWKSWFPKLGSRSQFAKQATNLWRVKQQLQALMVSPSRRDTVHLVDGFPLPVSHIKRAPGCQRFKGDASYGYCASKSEHYYGFKGHILVDLEGGISGLTVSQAHESEREAVWELTKGVKGLLLGDKGYLGAEYCAELATQGLELQTPVRHNMKDALSKPWRTQLNRLRRRVETTIGQLVEQFNIQRTWARNLWSLTNRLTRKILAHGSGVLFNRERNLPPTQLAQIIG